jgi:conjugative transfer pilus assembly protein TraH
MKFKRKSIIRFIAVCTAYALVFSPVLSYANWLDSWYTQKTSSGPTYYKGQQRGYWTTGGFSARAPVDTIHPFSFSPPLFRGGCGGIDAFGGGVALMNFKYLVSKLQNILSSAASVAFDMALKVLCPECAEAIKSMEAIANQLNALSLNSCQAGKALVAVAAKAMDPGESDQEVSDRIAEYSQDNGLNDSYEGFKRAADGVGNSINGLINSFGGSSAGAPDDTSTPNNAGTGQLTAGCNAQYIGIFATKGSMLNNIANAQGVSTDITALIRAAIGDFYLVSDQAKVVPITACSNSDDSLLDIIDGYNYTRGPGLNDTCKQMNSSGGKTIRDKVTEDLSDIVSSMKNRGTLTPAQMNFIDNCPLPVALILKSAIGMQDEDMVIGIMADVTAKAMAFRFIVDTQTALSKMLQYAESAKAQGGGSNPKTCKIQITQAAVEGAQEMQERLKVWQESMKSQMALAYKEYETLMNLVKQHENQQNTFYQALSKRFGMSVASRATAGM